MKRNSTVNFTGSLNSRFIDGSRADEIPFRPGHGLIRLASPVADFSGVENVYLADSRPSGEFALNSAFCA